MPNFGYGRSEIVQCHRECGPERPRTGARNLSAGHLPDGSSRTDLESERSRAQRPLKTETVREPSRRFPGNSKPGQLLLPKLIEQFLDGEAQLLGGLVGPRLDRSANLVNALFADFGVAAEVIQ